MTNCTIIRAYAESMTLRIRNGQIVTVSMHWYDGHYLVRTKDFGIAFQDIAGYGISPAEAVADMFKIFGIAFFNWAGELESSSETE